MTLAFSVTVDNWPWLKPSNSRRRHSQKAHTLTSTSCPTKRPLCRQKEPCGAIGMLHREKLSYEPSPCFVLQEPRAAFSAAKLRQLLREEQLAPEVLIGFSDEDLTNLVDKGLRTGELLRFADVAMLGKPPALPEALIRPFLAKFNPGALTAGTGGRPRAAGPYARLQAACLTCGTVWDGHVFIVVEAHLELRCVLHMLGLSASA